MNNLLQLKGTLIQRKSPSRPGAPTLPNGVSVNLEHLEKLKSDLERLYEIWNKDTLISGALVTVFYNRVVPKSKRITTLLSKGSELSNDSIVGAKFSDVSNPKHLITHFIDVQTIKNNIEKLEKCIHILNTYCSGSINNEGLKKIDRIKSKIEQEGLKKSTFMNVVVDSSNVEKFDILDNSDQIKDEYIITLYSISTKIEDIMEKLEIPHSDFSKLDDNTIRLEPRDLAKLKQRAPYLIAMATTDISKYTLEDFEDKHITNTITIPTPSNEPIIGVIDTLFDENVYFKDWVESVDLLDKDIPRDSKDYIHGTAVTSIIVDGPTYNPKLDDGCGRFRVRHFGVARNGTNSSFSIMRSIKNIVETNTDIKVWNLSLGSNIEINPNFISPEAALLDQLQFENDVIFIVAGTNKNNDTVIKIGSPADSINSIVVNSVDFNGKKATYSRKGKVLSFFNKPDICYYGGDVGEGIMTCVGTGEHLTMGTSFAAPWITRKMAYLIQKIGLTRETAKALLIDSATGWKSIDEKESEYIGFGIVPIRIEDIINSPKDEIRFYIEGVSELYDTYTHNIPVPLYKDKYPFIAKATLCYFPKCSRNQGVDYTNTELDIYFGRIGNDGKIKDINENIQSEGNIGFTTEKSARSLHRKWDNVKHINQNLKGRLMAKQRYDSGLWGLSVKTKERLWKRDGEGIKFGVVITLKEINGVNRIDEFINQCTLRGWLINKIDIENRIDIYNIAEEEIEFE